MKKVIAILMVLMMVSGVMFADPTTADKTLTLTTTVAGLLNSKITAASTDVAGYQAATVLETMPIVLDAEGMPIDKTFYFNIRTNLTTGITVGVKANSFAATGANTSLSRISYSLTAGSGDDVTVVGPITSSNEPAGFTDFYSFLNDDTGVKVDSRPITVSLNPTEYAAAGEGAYLTTVVFNVQAD